MNTIRWIIGSIAYYAVVIIGTIVYVSLLNSLTLWKWIIPYILLSLICAMIIGLLAYYIALTIIYSKRITDLYRIPSLFRPLIIMMGPVSTVILILAFTGHIGWLDFAKAIVQIISWVFALSRCILTNNKYNEINLRAIKEHYYRLKRD